MTHKYHATFVTFKITLKNSKEYVYETLNRNMSMKPLRTLMTIIFRVFICLFFMNSVFICVLYVYHRHQRSAKRRLCCVTSVIWKPPTPLPLVVLSTHLSTWCLVALLLDCILVQVLLYIYILHRWYISNTKKIYIYIYIYSTYR